MLLLGLLPLAALGLLIALLRRRGRKPAEAVILGPLLWAYGAAIANEALSLFGALTFISILAAWSLAFIALAFGFLRSGPLAVTPRRWPTRIRSAAAGLIAEEWILAAALIIIGSATLLVALVCPPNNWDSQTYHLPRIEHWIQNRSFDFYLTRIDRQLIYPGLAEALILPLRLLSGGDRWDNLLQWLAGAGSVFLVGRIALALGASRRGIAFTRLMAATLPIGILESSSTQNDLVVTFFLLSMAERLLTWRESLRATDAGFFAVAAGLALATKGTAYLIGLPLGLWFLAANLRAGPRALAMLIACGFILLLPNLPGYLRNLDYSGAPLGTGGEATNNAAYGPGELVVNAVRNVVVNFATQNSDYDKWLTRFVHQQLATLGLDADAPEITFPGTSFSVITYQNNEDIAANPVQLILGAAAVIAVLLRGASAFPRRRYALCILGATFLFLIVLRWQPWITRLQLPILALTMPLTAFFALERESRRARIGAATAMTGMAILLIVVASPGLWSNYGRPLFPAGGFAYSIWARTGDEILFLARFDLYTGYESAAVYVAQHGDSQIGLVTNDSDWEYPLW
ncbi:MAG TPA: hypothetical protein VH184_06585, partial [Dongiaceae bacterium]|nr:hypothetical protein [Dongiaceae bacterium]